MKNLFKILIPLFLFSGFSTFAQEPGDSRPLADNSTFKGRREIKREKKIKGAERKNAKHQERKAMKKRDYGQKIVIGKRKRGKVKNKEKKSKLENADNG